MSTPRSLNPATGPRPRTTPTAADSEARLRSVLEHSPSPIFVKDLDGRYVFVNAEWTQVSGIDAGHAVGRTAAECWPARAEAIEGFERALVEDGSSHVADERVDTPQGPRDFIVVRFFLRDAAGRPSAICAIATDITERKQMERELSQRDLLLRTVLKASPDIITIVDRDGRPHQVSDAELKLFGQAYGDLEPRRKFGVVHPDDASFVREGFRSLVEGVTRRVSLRYRVRRADGHHLTVESAAQAVVDEQGRFAGAVVVTRDVTAKLKADMRLGEAREAAERASEAKSEFLSRMSHELRTPLNSVLGFAQLLQMDELPDDQFNAVDHILAAGRHLLDLIDEVLDIARIESGHLELSMTTVPTAEIVGEALQLTRPLAGRTGVSLRNGIDPGAEETVLADRQRLLQVLLNLLSNVVKYNHPGGTVTVTFEQAGAGRLRFAVTDTGRGIHPDIQGRVFEPFDRLGAEVSGPEGTGVGLSLSRQLTEHMGGRMYFESAPGVGSTFYVELGEAHESNTDAGRPPTRRLWATDEHHRAGVEPFRVLLVEQDLSSLELVERVLERRADVKVLAAMHASLAVELAREHQPDLILLDMSVLEPSSAAVIERLSQEPATREIPVAVIVPQVTAHQVRDFLQRGVVGCLGKPIDVPGLLALVDSFRTPPGDGTPADGRPGDGRPGDGRPADNPPAEGPPAEAEC